MKINHLLFLLLLTSLSIRAQESFTIQEAVAYGKKNAAAVKNAQVDIQDANLQIDELYKAGLPQIAGQFQYTYNAIVPTSLIEAKNFNPMAAEGEVMKVKFGVPWGGQAGIGVNQLIFDASWLVGLRAADVYRQLANQGVTKAEEAVAENVIKAYYSVLVAEERAKILALNIQRLDSLIRDTQILNEQGFVEKIDVDRLTVQRNNLITENQKINNLIGFSYQLLKFQMSFPLQKELSLKDKLADSDITALQLITNQSIDYSKRVEYTTLQTQRKLTELNIERYQKGYYPSVFFSGSLGAGHSNPRFNPFERWFGASSLSIGARIPIYDSGVRKVQIQRQQLSLVKIDNGAEQLRESFELQNSQALMSLTNGLQSLEVQRRNLALAEEVLRVSKIKYTQGLGTNLEVINASASLKEAQTNYIAALYDVLIAKVDLDKARGELGNR